MPTLNQSYNRVLESWKKQGCDSKPECEDCGCDLTGKDVVESHYGWLCTSCAEAQGIDPNDCGDDLEFVQVEDDDYEDDQPGYSREDWQTRRAEMGYGE